MCPAIETEPAPRIASGLGAGNISRTGIPSRELVSFPIGAARYRAWQIRPATRAAAPIDFTHSDRKRSESEAVAPA